ncbi:MAG TPA: protein-glutamate O-methyltransferase CheR [Syntrophomonadaceae bacterium]|nr:protein-glutamate O-methyltransferase CheR [Syntrophomonadaceae bacterium]
MIELGDLGWEWFISKFEALSKIDLTAYKRPQMERRINSFMRSVNSENYKEFISLLNKDQQIYKRFLEHITINVSEFFRNINHWQVMEKEIIPLLMQERKSLKIWSAGCSTGEEPYSLAMMLKENRWKIHDCIYATDIDKDVLIKASQGIYTERAMEGVTAQIKSKYFNNLDEGYEVKDEIKKMVNFQQHNLLRDVFPKNFDLIVCRNVVIYFTEGTKEGLYRKFADSLRKDGILFIGSTEQIFQAKELGLKSVATFFYQKD